MFLQTNCLKFLYEFNYYIILGTTCNNSTTTQITSGNRNELVTQATTTLPPSPNPIIFTEIVNLNSSLQAPDTSVSNNNINCNFSNGCQPQSSSTTSRPFAISFSFSPLFGSIQQPTQTEASLGTERVSEDVDYLVESDELPAPGLGENFINEVYRLDNNETASSPFPARIQKTEASQNATTTEQPKTVGKEETTEDIKEVVNALRGLIQLLNTTDKGRKKLENLKKKLYVKSKPSKAKHFIKVENVLLGQGTKHTQSLMQQPPNHNLLYTKEYYGQDKAASISQELINPSQSMNSKYTETLRSTIPPHLVPLGPDAQPLINPDGTLYDQINVKGGSNSQMFSYLNNIAVTTSSPILTSIISSTTLVATTESEDKDMITTMIDSVRDLPMDTKRHMLANMMFMVPMAALTMAAAGIPHLAIAPLATLIPGFLFAAFTETNPAPRTEDDTVNSQSHSHGSMSGSHQVGHPPRTGISGLINGLREFYSQSRENQTLHINTGNILHHHG